jgi:hypothetical protein
LKRLLWRCSFWLRLRLSDTLNNRRLCRFIDRWLVCWRLFSSRLWCRCFFWRSVLWRSFLWSSFF